MDKRTRVRIGWAVLVLLAMLPIYAIIYTLVADPAGPVGLLLIGGGVVFLYLFTRACIWAANATSDGKAFPRRQRMRNRRN